jgi:Phosphotransferase enzyme family
MGVRAIADGREAWGWWGRTVGRPVIAADGMAWLRVSCAPADEVVALYWNGNMDAETRLPRSVPRPRLQDLRDWNEQRWTYRAELFEHVALRPVADSPAVAFAPELPRRWWEALRRVLDDVAAVTTDRIGMQQGFLDWVMPRYLGASVETVAPSQWTTAHGDFHYANLCAPDLYVLDWEGWGTAPRGYDAAMLHSYCLLVPKAAQRVRCELGHILDTPEGKFAELVAISELLYAADRCRGRELVQPLRQRAADLLGRSLPTGVE